MPDAFTRTYADRTYRYSTLVRHGGAVLAFAMDDRQRIHYSVLDPGAGPTDADGWLANPQELPFAAELARVGYGVADQDRLPQVALGATAPPADGTPVPAAEVDHFLSTTARFTADAPFTVLSDGVHVYLFRQSIRPEDAPDRILYVTNNGTPVLDDEGHPVPMVDGTLLADRYVLVGPQLQLPREVRFQRSRSRTRPANAKDGLGATDLENAPFYEPTQALQFVGHVTDGSFGVAVVPTSVVEVSRWQFALPDPHSDRINLVNVERTTDGLFDTLGHQFLTCPDHPDVFATEPGTCPAASQADPSRVCGLTLIPASEDPGYAGSALDFASEGDRVDLLAGSGGAGAVGVLGSIFTVEAWLAPRLSSGDVGERILLGGGGTTGSDGLSVWLSDSGAVRAGVGDGSSWHETTSPDLLRDGVWQHLAVTCDGRRLRVYVGGVLAHVGDPFPAGPSSAAEGPDAATNVFPTAIGAPTAGYRGLLDELRIWSVRRTARDLQAGMCRRLVGLEPALSCYLRLDEGEGGEVWDVSPSGLRGAVTGASWVTSTAPIADSIGISRSSVGIAGRSVSTGVSLLLYSQQEEAHSGYRSLEQAKLLKRSSRVLLAVGTRPADAGGGTGNGGAVPADDAVAVVDVGVSGAGKVAELPATLHLPTVEALTPSHGSPEELLARRAANEQLASSCRSEIATLQPRLRDVRDAVDYLTRLTSVWVLPDAPPLLAADAVGRFTAAHSALVEAEAALNDLYAAATTARALFFTDAYYGGTVVSLPIGSYSNAQLLGLNLSHVISSMQIPPELHVTGHTSDTPPRNGGFDGNVADLGSWNDLFASLTIELNGALNQARENAYNAAIAAQDTARRDIVALRDSLNAELTAGNARLAELTTTLAQAVDEIRRATLALGGGSTAEMPLLSLDRHGLSASGALLPFVRTPSAPRLTESAQARVAMYVRNTDDELTAIHLDTRVERPSFALHAATGEVLLAARTADIGRPDATGGLTVALDDGGTGSQTCTLTITLHAAALTVAETWQQLPLDAAALVDVLTGRASHDDYDYAGAARTTAIGVDLRTGSRLVNALLNGASGSVDPSRTPTKSGVARSCQWTSGTPGNALELDGSTSAAPADGVDQDGFSPRGDLTVEAWLRPEDTLAPARVVSSRPSIGPRSSYALGLRSKNQTVALRLSGTADWLRLSGLATGSGAGLTLEAWIRPDSVTGFRTVVAHGAAVGSPEVTLRILNGHYQFGLWDGSRDHFASGPDRAADVGSWVHLSGTFDGRAWRIYRNAVLEAELIDGANPAAASGIWTVGAAAPGVERLFAGAVDEIRIWGRDRSAAQLAADSAVPIAAGTPDLLGVWRFGTGLTRSVFGTDSPVEIHGRPSAVPTALPNLLVTGTVGDQRVTAQEAIRSGEWTHVAMAYAQHYGLALKGGGYLDCGASDSLDVGGDLTLELGVRLDDVGSAHGLVSRGVLGDQEHDSPYDLSVDGGGHLSFTFQSAQHAAAGPFVSTTALRPGTFSRVAVSRKRSVQATVTSTTGTGNTPGIPDVSVKTWYDISFFVDGRAAGGGKYSIDESHADTGSSSSATRVGVAYPGGRTAGLRGQISEIRIWNVAREAADIGVDLKGRETGLVSWWRLAENEGNTTADEKSANTATFAGPVSWVSTPDPAGSSLVLYRNGDVLPSVREPVSATVEPPHFRVGVAPDDAHEHYRGQLEELRLWSQRRTAEQLADNLFRRLTGERENLLAYYTFDEQNEPGILADDGPRDNRLRTAGVSVLSTAPVADEAPQVQDALLQVTTGRTARISATPDAMEYADLQTDAAGASIGIFKRCYALIRDGRWSLVTGFKVGDMITEWVGQVQTDPQLMGFIEGAPPVPSENLTLQDSYADASSVSLTEATSSTYTYASSRDKGFNTSLEASVLIGAMGDDQVGFGFEKGVDKWAVMGGLKTSFENSLGWLDNATSGQGRALTVVSTLGLRGRRENAPAYAGLGARYVPDNTGFALVQSTTADVFALRLADTGALIAYSMQPNPDIPRDWNILTFPINPAYTKQGTLDGKVGLDPDESYPQALTYSPDSSYFKPIEAYALKNRIAREEERLRTLFDQFDAGAKGRRQSGVNFTDEDLAAGGVINKLPHLDKRNLVNTYVWTAAGGLYAEEEQSLDTREEVTGGSYSFTGLAGFDLQLLVQVVAPAAQSEISAMFGGHLNLTVTKGLSSSSTFGAAVSVAPESDLSGTWEGEPTDRRPGKVDAYRFLTFYLQPDPDNHDFFFRRVVDPIWLAQDPAASALREAQQQANRPPCWRVLHRVTFVSRVQAALQARPGTVEHALHDLDLDSNYELIRTLEPFVRDKAGSYAEFSQAVHRTVARYLPALVPHTEDILAFLVLYFGVPDVPGVAASADGAGGPGADPPSVRVTGPSSVTLPGPAAVSATVLDEADTDPAEFSLQWTTISGPAPAVFAAERAASTSALFPQAGTYRLRLTAAAPGRPSGHGDLTVTVAAVPGQPGSGPDASDGVRPTASGLGALQ